MSQIKKSAKKDIKKDVETDTILLDNILDKKLVKFDNKQQLSMFFTAYKSINALYKELADSVNYTIPDEILKKVVLEIVPSIIKDYNSNLRKRCRVNIVENIQDETICLARKIDGSQCSRKKYNNNDLCKNHITKLPNGRVDIPLNESLSTLDGGHTTKEIFAKTYDDNDNQTETSQRQSDNIEPDSKFKKESVKAKELTNTMEKDDMKAPTPAPVKVSKRGRKSKIQFDPRQYDNEYITLWEDIVEGEKVLVDNANNIYTFNLEHPVYIGKKDATAKLNIRKFMDEIAIKKQ